MRIRIRQFAPLLAAALAACAGSSPDTPTGTKQSAPPPPAGGDNLVVTATTGGNATDPTGYVVLLDGNPVGALAGDGQVMLELRGLAPGTHTVSLGDLAPGCSVSGMEPRTIVLPDSQPYPFDEVDFAVFCMSVGSLPPGTLTVYASVLHASEPYEILFRLGDGQQLDIMSIGMGSSTLGSFTGLADSTYTVSPHPIHGNYFYMYCHWISAPSATATLSAGSGAAVLFVIGCGDS